MSLDKLVPNKTKKAKGDLHVRGKRRCDLALQASIEMECLFNALIEQGRIVEDLDDSSVIKALASRGVTLTRAAITALGDDSAAAADSIDDWERTVSHGG